MILGEHITYRGELTVGSGIKISYVSQDYFTSEEEVLRNISGLPAWKNVCLRPCCASWIFQDSVRKRHDSYSEGQKKKVPDREELCERAHLYIWDEPLNFIDVYSRMQIEELCLCGNRRCFRGA